MRHVSFQAGYIGEPVDWLWRDPESFANLLTIDYTDREPESLLVAEHAIACFGSRGFRRYGGPIRVPGFRTRDGRRMHVQWMVQSLAESSS